MDEKRATLEIIAPTIEEAISKGLDELGLPEEQVEVEVLDQGSKGLFGLGSRHVRIRLAVKSAADQGSASEVRKDFSEEEQPVTAQDVTALGEKRPLRPPEQAELSLEKDEELIVARDIVDELLTRMKVHARVTARYGEADEEKRRIPILVDVRGDDLSILIGRRAETLNALQYITSMIVGKELDHAVTLIIDVEGYRARREGQLRQLARRMADQAIKTGRRQVLEPMPANERRIIHIELREFPGVTTESIGEEPRRKVTIIPKS